MSEFVVIKPENYLQYLPLDIVAFHFSEPGACGYHGVLRIITSKKELYMVHYYYDQWDDSDLLQVCPILRHIEFGIFRHTIVLPEWDALYMGLGNSLFLKKDIGEKLDFTGMKGGEIYQQWTKMILEVI